MSREARAAILRTARFIASHWRPYLHRVPLLLILTACNGVLVALAPGVLGDAVDGVVARRTLPDLVAAAATVLLVGAAQVIVYLALVSTRLQMNLSFDYGVRLRAMEHLLHADTSAVGRHRTGDVVARLTDDVPEKLAWFMCSGIFRLLEALAVLGAGTVAMVQRDPVLAAWATAPIPVLFVVYVLTASRLEARSADLQEAISRESEALESCLGGMRVVKAFAAEPMQRELIVATVERQRRAEMALVRWQALLETMYGHVWQLSLAVVLWVGAAGVLRGTVELGTLVAFDAWVVLLVHPVIDLAQFLVRGRQSIVSASRVAELEAAPRANDANGAAPRARRPGDALPAEEAAPAPAPGLAVRYEDASFRYRDAARDAVAGVTLEASPGAITAITGPIASGKTTALQLAVRLQDPSGGRVLVGGRDVREWNPSALRRAVAFVPQEPILLSASIAENVALGRPWVTEDDVAAAVEAADLAAEVATFPDGLATRVGPRGVRLSGGQKQRVALARALAGRPSVLLLDDVTASLDAATEERVWRSLYELIPSCTAIVVTHRPALLARARHVVRLPEPAAVASG